MVIFRKIILTMAKFVIFKEEYTHEINSKRFSYLPAHMGDW